MRRWWKRLLVLVLLAAGGAALRYTVFRADPVPVTVFVVARGRVEETVTNSKAGTVMTRHHANLSPELGGRVAELRVQKGDPVKAGDVLLRLEDSEHRARVELAVRGLAAAREGERETCLSAELARRDFDRAAGLAQDRLVSEQVLDQAENRRDVAVAACEAARARSSELSGQLDLAKSQLAKTVLRAPFDGVVAELSVEVGEWITPSPPGVPMPSVVDLIDAEAIYVSAPLDEVDRGKVRLGLPVRITMDAFPGRSFTGRVTRVAPYIRDIAEQSRTFEVEAVFDDPEVARALPPGASADIEAILSSREGALRVPSYAVLEGNRVLVLEESRLASRQVAVGLRNWEFSEVASGLREGDEVVVSLDRAEVKEGARARRAAVASK